MRKDERMRKYLILNKPVNDTKKIMIYDCSEGVYVFYYDSVDDVPGIADEWYEDLNTAEQMCREKFGFQENDWISVDDPMEYCQHDIIAPVRIKGRNEEKPQWGTYEKCIDGKWAEIQFN